MQTSRLEAFSDGVFAIAATLLILDVTADARGGALGTTLEHSWPQFAAYTVAFVTTAIVLFTALSGFYIVGSSYAKGPLRAPSASSS